jgi:hypothetical protein
MVATWLLCWAAMVVVCVFVGEWRCWDVWMAKGREAKQVKMDTQHEWAQ